MNIRIKNLAVSDFPGIDEAKFSEWKVLQIKTDREQRIVSIIAVGIWCMWSILAKKPIYPLIFIGVFIIGGYVFYFTKTQRLRQLRKELKISDRLWAKKKGRAFTE